MTKQRRLIRKHVEELIGAVHRMTEVKARELYNEFSAMNETNCAWYEFRVKALIVEIASDRLRDLERQKQQRLMAKEDRAQARLKRK